MPYPPDPVDIRTPGKPPVVSRADEREGLRQDFREIWNAEKRALDRQIERAERAEAVVVRYREAIEHFVNLYPQYKAYFEKIND